MSELRQTTVRVRVRYVEMYCRVEMMKRREDQATARTGAGIWCLRTRRRRKRIRYRRANRVTAPQEATRPGKETITQTHADLTHAECFGNNDFCQAKKFQLAFNCLTSTRTPTLGLMTGPKCESHTVHVKSSCRASLEVPASFS